MQGMRRQKQRRPLRRHHLRGLQGLFSTIAELRGKLPVSQEQELRGRQSQPEPVPVLPVTEVPQARDESGW